MKHMKEVNPFSYVALVKKDVTIVTKTGRTHTGMAKQVFSNVVILDKEGDNVAVDLDSVESVVYTPALRRGR